MAIKVGDRVPNGTFMVMTGDGPKPMTSDELFKGKKVVLFAVPGAFTPTCHRNHLPGFVKNAAAIKKYLAPTFDGLVKQGAATYYGLDTQYVNTGPASLRCLVITYPNADGMDKWATAVGGVLGKLSGADREAFFGSTVPDSRRDIMARITHSGHK